MNRSSWAQASERTSMPMLRAMTWISLRLGRRLSRLVHYPATAYFLLASPSARRASREFLQRALGRPATLGDIWQHMLTFGSTIHDRLFLLNERFDLFDIELHNKALVRDAWLSGRGAFLLGAHLGSFEVMRAIGRTHPELRVAIAMYEENVQHINTLLAAMNPTVKQDVIGLGQVDSMLRVRDYLDSGSMIGMLADRSLLRDAGGSTRSVEFLGTPAEFPLGPLHMAAMLRRPVIFMTGLYRGGNRYDIHFETLADFSKVERGERAAEIERALRRYVGFVEQYCRAAPYNWFNFYDFWQHGSASGGASTQAPAPRRAKVAAGHAANDATNAAPARNATVAATGSAQRASLAARHDFTSTKEP
ncbi:acyl-CoA synthetase [Paraburkholderia phosphatilytica]|uniref:LpxL/LpxP family acyltransferase n=1 Tax=Paraburkholderia phosphatilytica TaxID=2282883 RepID=UPI000E4B5D3C|nr:acyl-CoA synthetase [Paraburkholderia phosphatilytica]